jgi:hypothetical protein
MSEYDLDILKLAAAGFCCSQIVIQLGLEVQGVSNPGLVRAVSGLCHGFPANSGACGAVTGAACLLGYYAGKGTPDADANERLQLMLAELSEWSVDYLSSQCGGIRCADIVDEGRPDTAVCGRLISDCYGRVMTLLMENGIDPGSADV